MIEVKDRVPTKVNRKKITFEDDGTVKYAIVEYADEPIEEGTRIGAEIFTEMQEVIEKKASAFNYTATVGIEWNSNENGGFYQCVNVEGITEDDYPIIDIVLGNDTEQNAEYLEAWGVITRITTENNQITLYANEKAPTVAFNIQLKVVR